jgi:hypothetical protein
LRRYSTVLEELGSQPTILLPKESGGRKPNHIRLGVIRLIGRITFCASLVNQE